MKEVIKIRYEMATSCMSSIGASITKFLSIEAAN
jgi:hypothetical protein